MKRVGERKAALGDVHRAKLSGEVVKSAEDVGVDLLKALHAARLQTREKSAFEQGVRLLPRLAVDRVVRVEEPVKEVLRIDVRKDADKLGNALRIKGIRKTLLSVRRAQPQPGSVTNQLISFAFQFRLEPLPVVPVLRVVGLIAQDANDVEHGEEPGVARLVPHGAHFLVVEESNRDLVLCHYGI